jgi:hypothetical protein
MPEISRFLGIVNRMYYRDHAPPHFPVEYAEHEIEVEIETGVVDGRFCAPGTSRGSRMI